MTALACKFYGLDYILFEEDSTFSSDTKAGTILTRTIEAFRRYGVDAAVLQKALRVEEIGEIERSTNKRRHSVETRVLEGETRFPFVLNLPQHHLEPILAQGLQDINGEHIRLRHQLLSFTQTDSGVTATFETPEGKTRILRQILAGLRRWA
jgi:3-(3-hydroxy-phenyl)propionate hydroxylase